MNTILVTFLEKTLNQYVQLDTEALQHLSNYQYKTIGITITDYYLSFYITPKDGMLSLSDKKPEKITASINGNSWALLKLGLDQRSAMTDKDSIQFTGDVDYAQHFHEFFKKINIDWEYYLAKYTGDSTANIIGRFTKKAIRFGKHAKMRLKENVTEYLQEEAYITPCQEEISEFFHDIDKLRSDIERLEQRIKRL